MTLFAIRSIIIPLFVLKAPNKNEWDWTNQTEGPVDQSCPISIEVIAIGK